mmetsp:Transcript_35023/g.99272  ORF Transcript_35023/g.99272 Transcript_35023/m.99272 type:complete len:381 (-) Transcript_35023:206-1348(-)
MSAQTPPLPPPRATVSSPLRPGSREEKIGFVRPSSSEHLEPIPDCESTVPPPADVPVDAQDHEAHQFATHHSRRHQCHLASWDQYFDQSHDIPVETRGTFRVYTAGNQGPVVFCLHGGGYTGLTWSLLASRLKDKYRVVAIDQRGHGATATLDDGDLSAETLAADANALWQQLYGEESPSTVLVGHSMGGAIAVHTASIGCIPKLEGVVVIDVVEGTALAALPAMMGILERRPKEFTTLDVAFEWALSSGTTRNPEAASVSLPSQLTPPCEECPNLRWVTHLEKSQPYWDGWYRGLSQAFLNLRCPKLLLLAGTDRLDKELTIGQMQGKFKLALLPVAGHAIQEDEPIATADSILSFMKHFQVGFAPELPSGSWGSAAHK